MNKAISILSGVFLFLSACTGTSPKAIQENRLTDFVDPFIGTGYHGHTYPGAAYPFGQIQLSPDNGTQGWDWCSGYQKAGQPISMYFLLFAFRNPFQSLKLPMLEAKAVLLAC